MNGPPEPVALGAGFAVASGRQAKALKIMRVLEVVVVVGRRSQHEDVVADPPSHVDRLADVCLAGH